MEKQKTTKLMLTIMLLILSVNISQIFPNWEGESGHNHLNMLSNIRFSHRKWNARQSLYNSE